MSRRIWDFPGGIHPAQNKQQSLQTAIVRADIPTELTSRPTHGARVTSRDVIVHMLR